MMWLVILAWYDSAVAFDRIQNVEMVVTGYMGKEYCKKCDFIFFLLRSRVVDRVLKAFMPEK